MKQKKISVIGAGFSGISAASCLAKNNFEVTVFEKNEILGGRARKFEVDNFMFDMGPSWYWMPDVFEQYFQLFGQRVDSWYSLKKLDPSYRVFYSKEDIWDIPSGEDKLISFFENIERGGGSMLQKFLNESKYKYQVGINKLVHKPGLSVTELIDFELLQGILKMHVFQSVSTYVRKYFKDPRLIQLLEFPVIFLGAPAYKIPALYTLMNYADMSLGTWYPMGGMYKIVEAMVEVAKTLGVRFECNSEIQKINIVQNKVNSVEVNGKSHPTDWLVASGDYHHIEQNLLPKEYRRYDEAYWQKRTMAPGSLIFYLGVKRRVKNLLHHNLFFDKDFSKHAKEIFEQAEWPSDPLFYVCVPSKSDPSVAPEGYENIFILMPVAPNLDDNETVREKYFHVLLERMESLTGDSWKEDIVFKRTYAHRDFITDYHSYQGNAYGLANTLMQTANLKPSIESRKLKNLLYTGHLTVPGPGVPPSLISGMVVANQLIKRNK